MLCTVTMQLPFEASSPALVSSGLGHFVFIGVDVIAWSW